MQYNNVDCDYCRGIRFCFLKATLELGIELILREINFSEDLKLITRDYQTVMGKAPIGVARLAKEDDVSSEN